MPVLRKTEIVGPIEETTEFAAGAQAVLLKPYPAADKLLREYVSGWGGAIRA